MRLNFIRRVSDYFGGRPMARGCANTMWRAVLLFVFVAVIVAPTDLTCRARVRPFPCPVRRRMCVCSLLQW